MGNLLFRDDTLPQADSFSPSVTPHMLWKELKNRAFRYKFKPQFSIGAFVVDLYCSELKLIVEVGGIEGSQTQNAGREDWLVSHGYTLVKFSHTQVLQEQEKVIEKIFRVCLHLTSLI